MLLPFLLPWPARGEVYRIATYNTELSRKGPGLLLRDIRRGDPQAQAVAQVIAAARADVLLLQNIDHDHDLLALRALRDLVAEAGWDYPHLFARASNRGRPSGLDLDGDGWRGGPGDAQGYGAFRGQGAMALLSRFPIDRAAVRDLASLAWRELPGALQPVEGGRPFPSAAAWEAQRLSSSGHWIVPVVPPGAPALWLLAFHATPPVFDGPEDLNGRRNHDEIRLWKHVLDGTFGPVPAGRFVLLGDANADPVKGDARRGAIRALLADARLQDPRPESPGAAALGDGADTVDWPEPAPGNMRVDYLLPSADWQLRGAGVLWPVDGALAEVVRRASRHRLVWADIAPGARHLAARPP